MGHAKRKNNSGRKKKNFESAYQGEENEMISAILTHFVFYTVGFFLN